MAATYWATAICMPDVSTCILSSVRLETPRTTRTLRDNAWSPGSSCERMGSGAGPLLVIAPVAGPDLDSGPVGGASPGHIEAETRLATHNGAIGVEGPLLVGSPVAVPDLHSGTSRGGMIGHIEALIAINLECAIGEGGPLLVGSSVAVPD